MGIHYPSTDSICEGLRILLVLRLKTNLLSLNRSNVGLHRVKATSLVRDCVRVGTDIVFQRRGNRLDISNPGLETIEASSRCVIIVVMVVAWSIDPVVVVVAPRVSIQGA